MSKREKTLCIPVDHYVGDLADETIDDPEFSFLDMAFNKNALHDYCIPVGSMREQLLPRMRELLEEDTAERKSMKFGLLKAVVDAGLDKFPENFEITNDDPDLREVSDKIYSAKAGKLAVEIAKLDEPCSNCSTVDCNLRETRSEFQDEHREEVEKLLKLDR